MASWVSTAASVVAGRAVSVLSAFSESAAANVVEKIVDAGFSFLSNRMLPRDNEAKLKRLEMALPQIRDVMNIAEALKMKDSSLGAWFEQFRNAVEASEDVLDELEYKKLEDMMKNQDEVGGSASRSKKLRSCPLNDGTLMRKLEKAVKMLDEAAANVKHIHQCAAKLGVHGISELQQETYKVRRETTSFLTEREVFGREVEKKQIIGWLKKPTDDHLSCFCILGAGGMGKTTLAQFVYQKMGKTNHFDKRVWVCISTKFSVEHITRIILGELGESSCNGKPLNAVQESLKEKIHSKQIFLVLDDIWDDDKRSDWEQLLAPLQFVQQGSKILITTRMKSVADLLVSVINTEWRYVALKGLPEKELLQLFNSYAFHGFNPDNYANLQSIGNQMVKLLKGSPLAAKVIGSLLNSSMDHFYWRRVLDRGSLFNLDQANHIIEVLKLSYYHLPSNLQACFRFCSIFPQDYKFKKDELIKMWMASGFLKQHSDREERLENIGEDYFNHLLKKSFFENSSNNTYYVMHDLVHELAQNVSNGECCRVEPNNKLDIIPSSVHHLSIHESEIQRAFHLENLHSLIITTSFNTRSRMDPFVLPNKLIKKSLRLLKISIHRSCQISDEISHLLHLRYLSINLINGYRSKCLFPASIHKFFHLQVLEFSGVDPNSSHIGIEPSKMTNLVNLRYMDLHMKIMKTIPRVRKLTSLQELTFYVGHESGHHINELQTLNNLRDLSIHNIENVGDPTEAKSANLLGKKNLRSLSLTWTPESNPNNPEQIIDNLQPNPDLTRLTIHYYKGQRSPCWMKDSPPLNLSVLRLLNCVAWKDQLFSCQMPHLKILDIHECPELDKFPDMPLSLTEFRLGNVGLTSLPNLLPGFDSNTNAIVSEKSSLRIVEIKKCANLISLDGFLKQGNIDLQAIEKLTIRNCEKLVYLPTQGFGHLTSLKNLTLKHCQNLTMCPNLPHSLINLEIWNVALSVLPDLPLSITKLDIRDIQVVVLPEYNTSSESSGCLSTEPLKSSLRDITIQNCPNLRSLNGFLQQEYIVFQSITYMDIEGCRNPVQLPTGAFRKFVSLTELRIWDCPMMVAVDNRINLLPTKLDRLVIKNCGELAVQLLESASHLTGLSKIWIKNCASITHIPCSENAFRSLTKLCIHECDKLIEHSSREPAHGGNMHGDNMASLKINKLSIGQLSLLLIKPLVSLRFVCELYVLKCSGMVTLPEQWLLKNSSTLKKLRISDARTVESLPAMMARLTALEDLEFKEAKLLEELPELPASLRILRIEDARHLKSLPSTMASLTALEELYINGADLLKELPDLPPFLEVKCISRSDGTELCT